MAHANRSFIARLPGIAYHPGFVGSVGNSAVRLKGARTIDAAAYSKHLKKSASRPKQCQAPVKSAVDLNAGMQP